MRAATRDSRGWALAENLHNQICIYKALHRFTNLYRMRAERVLESKSNERFENSSEDVTCDLNACYDPHYLKSAAAAQSSCRCPRVSLTRFSHVLVGADHTC